MAAAMGQNAIDIAASHEPKNPALFENDHGVEKEIVVEAGNSDEEDWEEPTAEDLRTLTRVSGKIPWSAYTIAFVELCERFGYYGCTVVYTNFIQRPLPPGSTTGRVYDNSDIPGALDMGQRASFGLTTFNQFWSYTTPLLGAYIADEYLGRFNTIFVAIAFAIVGHVILIISATPQVLQGNGAIGAFVIGLVCLGIGTGGFKANVSPLIAEQYKETKLKVIRDKKTGERVISDPTITHSRIFLYFYMMVNVGSLTGQISMVYVEKYVGFWCSFLLPTVMYCFCPIVLLLCRNMYNRNPPTGSVVAKAAKLYGLASKGKWTVNPVALRKNFASEHFWNDVKPSHLGARKPAWMTFDDAWVDQVARGFAACQVFTWIPLYWVAYNQMNNNLTSQAATMTLNGVPNDIITNLNPISLVIFIPIVDNFLYPTLRKYGIKFTPIKRMTVGFGLASLAMISATAIQYYIYKLGPCGNYMNECDDPAPINVWVQTIPYVLIGFSEIFTSITGLEYAFTKAPTNMRSLVTSYWHFMSAFSNAIGQALVALSEDPLLVWNYATVAMLAAVGGTLFWLAQHKLDKKEDIMNMLPETNYIGKDRRHSIGSVENAEGAHRHGETREKA